MRAVLFIASLVLAGGASVCADQGNADVEQVYVFTKGGEVIIVLMDKSDMIHEQMPINFDGIRVKDLRRFAEHVPGMGEGAPGRVPKFEQYPPQ